MAIFSGPTERTHTCLILLWYITSIGFHDFEIGMELILIRAVPTRWNLLWVRLMSGSHSNLGCTDTHGFQFMTPNDASYLLLCQIPLCDVRFFVPRQHNARLWLLEILQQTTPGLRGPEGPGMIHTRHSIPPSESFMNSTNVWKVIGNDSSLWWFKDSRS